MNFFSPRYRPPKPVIRPYDIEIRRWAGLKYATWVMTGDPPLPWGIDKTVAENDHKPLLREARELCKKYEGWIYVLDERGTLLEVYQWQRQCDPENADLSAIVEIQHNPAEFQGLF